MTVRDVPPRVAKLFAWLSETLGVDDFEVFGGTALSLLVDDRHEHRDIDVAIPRSPPVIVDVLAHLAACSDSRSPLRRYWIGLTHPVLMLNAEVDGMSLDINFIDEPDRIGCFDVDSVRWRSPGLRVIDPHNAQRALHTRTARLIRSVEDENPLLLLTRFLRLVMTRTRTSPTRQPRIGSASARMS